MPKVCIWVSRRVSFAGVVVLRRTVYRKEKKKRKDSSGSASHQSSLSELGFMIRLLAFGRLGSGEFSLQGSFSVFPWQLPFTTSLQKELATRSAWVFWRNCWTLGLSFVAPLCRWHPKNFSSGS